jgi:hypothetical protein
MLRSVPSTLTRIEGSHLSLRDVERLLANPEIEAFSKDLGELKRLEGMPNLQERSRDVFKAISTCCISDNEIEPSGG